MGAKVKKSMDMDRGGGGQVISVLAFYLDNQSSNPAEGYSLFL